jgi:hypothetical protein
MGKVVTIPALYLNTTIFIENFKKLKRFKRGFRPRRFDSKKNAIITEEVLHRHRSKRTVLGTGTVLSFISYLLFISYPEKKKFFNHQSLFL